MVQKNKLKIKIKIKHILLVMVAIFVFLPNLIIGVATLAYKKDLVDSDMNKTPRCYYLQGLLSMYVNMPKISPFEHQAYYYMGINEYSYLNDNIYYTTDTGMSVENMFQSRKGIDGAIEYHEKGMESGIKSDYYVKNALALISLYHKNGQVDKAYQIVDKLKDSKNEKQVSYAFFAEATLNIKTRKYDEAIKSFETMDVAYFYSKDKYLAEAYKLKGDYKKSAEYMARAIGKPKYIVYNNPAIKKNTSGEYKMQDVDFINMPEYDANTIYIDNLDEIGSYYMPPEEPKNHSEHKFYINSSRDIKLKRIDEARENFLNNVVDEKYRGSIKGQLMINGAPMQGAVVVLERGATSFSPTNGIFANNLVDNSYAYVAEDGTFEFNNVIEGEYTTNIIFVKQNFKNLNLKSGFIQNNIVNVERGKTVNISFDTKYYAGTMSDGENTYDTELTNIIMKSDNQSSIPANNYDAVETTSKGDKLILERVVFDENQEHDENLDYFPYELGKDISFYQDEPLEFYKLFTDNINSDGFDVMYEGKILDNYNQDEAEKFYADLKNEKQYELYKSHNHEFVDCTTSEQARIVYPEEVLEYMKKNEYYNVLEYYEKAYEENPEDTFAIQMLIKLYTTGINEFGKERDVNKAIELADRLHEIDKTRSLDAQVRRYIYRMYSKYLYLK